MPASPLLSPVAAMARARVAPYRGRPVLWINDEPCAATAYSPVAGRRPELMRTQSERFFAHDLDIYFLSLPPAVSTEWGDGAFWMGDQISASPLRPMMDDLVAEAEFVLAGNPGAHFIVRYGPEEPRSWRELHQDELFITEDGQTLPCPSLASALYNRCAEELVAQVVRYCEGLSIAPRIIGYWSGHRVEGSHEPLIEGFLYDHGPRMRQAWGAFLLEKYGDEANLQRTYGAGATFQNTPVPRDVLRGQFSAVAAELYWQGAESNGPLRDYLELGARLWHGRFTGLARAMQDVVHHMGRERVLIYDALKQPMQGWSNHGFFSSEKSWPVFYPDISAGSGALGVAPLLEVPGMDGLITPHDYQARGAGGVYAPEAAADSCILRGRLHLCEMDTRTWCGTDINFPARDAQEFAAVTWRNLATGWSRGFASYYMDVYQDWFADEAIHAVIGRQVQVQKEALHWQHEEVPCIAVIVDDSCVLETNGSGHVLNEQVAWEWRSGLAHCGVPHRIYLLQDLELDTFPAHRLFYFPNLYRATPERLQLLQEKVFGDERVVLWGPGSGISDGRRIGTESASSLTGFHFDLLPLNDPRRVQISNFDHPITRVLDADTLYGSPTAYGPVLYPTDGVELGRALARGGRDRSGLAVKTLESRRGRWHSVFTTAAPLPSPLWRSLARFAGAHVYSETGDVVLASSCMVALHGLKSERKTLHLPGPRRVRDVIGGRDMGVLERIEFDLRGPGTHIFSLEVPA